MRVQEPLGLNPKPENPQSRSLPHLGVQEVAPRDAVLKPCKGKREGVPTGCKTA